MSYEQIARDCDTPDVCGLADCTVIEGVLDGRIVSRMHMDAAVHIEHRLNQDYPEVIDYRGNTNGRKLAATPWCDDCKTITTQPRIGD